ncbi:ATP-binding protein [Roseofilum sp. BLCC_M154]|uniref:histidine kinase n=1 Tax=Roseofilum acuticapitatum BLCC-M154 TaxID=3022444 RepID=A0ABT7AS96_9CYAN|nr:ATP-binding protein [Roseofilum acuticapitatum]MDJ1169447.1 ATP-binding protein [Roseofilum acuticapitatum BLCC-M154]
MDSRILIQGYPISRYTGLTGAIALAYFTVAYITTTILGLGAIPPICPAAGIALGVLVVYGIEFWPGVALGSWAYALILGHSPIAAIALALSYTLGPTLGVYLLGLCRWQPIQANLKGVFKLILWGAIVSTGISASLDVALGLWLHTLSNPLEHLWSLWFGQTMGVLLVTPILVYAMGRWSLGNWEVEVKGSASWMETAIAIMLGLGVSSFVFGVPHGGWIDRGWIQEVADVPLEYLCFPLMVWAAFRYGAIGVFATSLLLALFALIGWSQDRGLLMMRADSPEEALFGFEILITSIEITAWILVVSLTELNLNTELLRHNQDRLSADITRREAWILELEATLWQQRQKLQENQEALSRSNQLKNCFFQAIAHDLRTTLMGILMLNQNLLKKPGETLSVSRSLLQRLTEGGDRQLSKLNTLLEVATLDADLRATQPKPINLALLLETVLENMQSHFQANQTHLTYHPPEQLPLVNANPQYIRRVFEHLLSNAIKHNPPGVAIQIELQAHSNRGIYCSVTDNGVGIPPEKLPYLFSLDPQASDSHTSTPLTGISLGLYQCDRILAAHGSKLGVESDLSQGTRFWFCLPNHQSISVNLS